MLAAVRLSETFVDAWADDEGSEAAVWRKVNDHLACVR